jgi:hypothetical protein
VMKTNYFRCPKKTWLDLPTTTVADTFCWQAQIRKKWVAGISCRGLSPTDSPRELPWTLQQLQPTAATNSLAAETDITSYRVHERPRWIWNKRIHRMQKNSTNIEIYEKPIRAVSWWASIITSHNNNGFPASASLCVFS